MKKKLKLIVLVFASIIIVSNAQVNIPEVRICKDLTVQELIQSEKLAVNMQLIESFNNYKAGEEYVSFTDIYYSLTGRERVEFLREYFVSDLDKESLNDIKNKVISEEDRVELSKEDIEWFIKIKAEIKSKNGNYLYSKN